MKKIFRILLPVLLLCCILSVSFLLVACDSEAANQTTDAQNQTTDSQQETPSVTTEEPSAEAEESATETAYTITFACDDQVTVTVYPTQSTENGTVTTTATARSGDTGEILVDGNGQVNFSIALESGYELGGITVTTGTYKNVKTPAETGVDGLYRITKIESDLTVTIKANVEETKYTATFVLDEGVTVTIYDTKDTTSGGTVATTAYARDGDTGEILSTGEGQINFVINLSDGYTLDGVVVTAGSYKNLKAPDETGVEGLYRITKIKSDLTVTITTGK